MQVTTFQELILALQSFWAQQACVLLQPFDMEMGAGTFHPGTFLRALGPEPWRAAHVQPSRRPADGRYGENPNRLQHFYQFQVILKPSPLDIQAQYLKSLAFIGIDALVDDIRFVEDNWESPSLGAWGLGFEVWQNGMEISQFTYFQQVGGFPCSPTTGELTYGLERIAMNLFGKDTIFDIPWVVTPEKTLTYGDVFLQNEVEMSRYQFEEANVEILLRQFDEAEAMAKHLIEKSLSLPAHEKVIQASHLFNILDARRAISVTERQRYILRLRHLSHQVASVFLASREALGFPLLPRETVSVG